MRKSRNQDASADTSKASAKAQQDDQRRKAEFDRHVRQFVGLDEMKQSLRGKEGDGHGNLQKFEQWARDGNWLEFGPDKNHYDWWMFPIPEKSNTFDMKYAVFEKEIEELKRDSDYMRDYRRGLALLFASWGWDLKESKPLDVIQKGQGWNYWDIRLYKAALSARSFGEQQSYRSMEAFTRHLISAGVKIGNNVKDLWGIRV